MGKAALEPAKMATAAARSAGQAAAQATSSVVSGGQRAGKHAVQVSASVADGAASTIQASLRGMNLSKRAGKTTGKSEPAGLV